MCLNDTEMTLMLSGATVLLAMGGIHAIIYFKVRN